MKRLNALRRCALAAGVSASLSLGLLAPAAAQPAGDASAADDAASPEDLAAVGALERTLVDAIAKAERSVVAIARSAPAQNAGVGAAPAIQFRANPRAAGVDPLAALRTATMLPPEASGAGVVIDRGLVLTQYLVVKPGEAHTVTDLDGNRYAAEILAADPRSGLAVLTLTGADDLPAFEIGRAEDLSKGRFVVAIGNPFAMQSDGQPTASWGVVANTARKAPPNENLNNVTTRDGTFRTTLHHFGSLIQTDARLGWNASGGALVTLDGKLVGVTTTASTIAGHERPAGYAIPLNAVIRRVVDALRDGREPEYGLLGIEFSRNAARSPNTGQPGIAVSQTFVGSPASAAGLVAGDLILTVAGRRTFDADSLQLAVSSLPPGDEADVRFERGGKPEQTVVRLGKAFVSGDRVFANRPAAWRGLRVDYATATPPEVLQRVAREGRIDPEGCVVVTEVVEGSPSWQEGVRPYQFISHVNGKRVASPEAFYASVRDLSETVRVQFTKPVRPERQPAVDGAAMRQGVLPWGAPAPAPPVVEAPLEAERNRLLRRMDELAQPPEAAAAEE